MHRQVLIAGAAVLAAAALAGTADAVTTGSHAPVRAPRWSADSVAQTEPATDITATSATLNGAVDPGRLPADDQFVYWPASAAAQWIASPIQSLSQVGSQTTSATLTGLTPDTTYDVRLLYRQAVGQGQFVVALWGAQLSFTTASAVSPTPPPVTTTTTATTPTTATTTTATPPAAPVVAPRAPVVAQTADVGTVSGSVSVTLPGASGAQSLGAGASIPLGAVVDARHGVVDVTNALSGGLTQSVTVWGGRFEMTQSRSGHTTFHLVGVPACVSGRLAHSARRRPASVSLWAHDHHGRYSTRGQNSVATVRGTVWETIESCAGTRTVVREGVVSVLDLHTHRSVLVHAGHSVLIPR